MIKKYNNISLMLGIPAFIIQMTGAMKSIPALFGLGTIMLLIAFGFYAKSKGRSPLWGLAAILGIIGVLLLAVLKEKPLENAENPPQK